MTHRPTFEPIWCACKACSVWWDDWQPNNVPVATWIAHIRTIRCPQCGKRGRSVLLRTTPIAEKPDGPHAA